MIGKDEAAIVRRAIRSAASLISADLIADTGSSDHTRDEIPSELAGLPRELLERAWVDFASAQDAVSQANRINRGYSCVWAADAVGGACSSTLDDGAALTPVRQPRTRAYRSACRPS